MVDVQVDLRPERSERSQPLDTVTAIEVRGQNYRYQAIVGSQLLDKVGSIIQNTLDGLKRSSSPVTVTPGGCRCAVISDANVARLFGERVTKSLTNAKLEPVPITIPAGEESKTLSQAGRICDEMLAAGLDRQSIVIGLGGGVVNDISGFVAAIFQRGIPHVQIPTTLLAMVDSSIGGKTGVNTRDGKNLLGAIHQPLLVIDDVDLLKTLPRRELNQGFAEIIKHAIIADAEMFTVLPRFDLRDLTPLVCRNIQIKSRIVAKDERDETGERALLNFGHTIGHGIERAGDYRTFLHGEAVSLGMVAAALISEKKAGLTKSERETIVALLQAFELPTKLPANFPRVKILDAIKFDKKFEAGEIRFVVTPKVGSARLASDVTIEDIREAIDRL